MPSMPWFSVGEYFRHFIQVEPGRWFHGRNQETFLVPILPVISSSRPVPTAPGSPTLCLTIMCLKVWKGPYILQSILSRFRPVWNLLKFLSRCVSAEQFRSRFEGKTYHKITIGLNLFVDKSLKDFETFWRQEEWKLVSLVLERFFTFLFLFSVLISFLVFAATVR